MVNPVIYHGSSSLETLIKDDKFLGLIQSPDDLDPEALDLLSILFGFIRPEGKFELPTTWFECSSLVTPQYLSRLSCLLSYIKRCPLSKSATNILIKSLIKAKFGAVEYIESIDGETMNVTCAKIFVLVLDIKAKRLTLDEELLDELATYFGKNWETCDRHILFIWSMYLGQACSLHKNVRKKYYEDFLKWSQASAQFDSFSWMDFHVLIAFMELFELERFGGVGPFISSLGRSITDSKILESFLEMEDHQTFILKHLRDTFPLCIYYAIPYLGALCQSREGFEIVAALMSNIEYLTVDVHPDSTVCSRLPDTSPTTFECQRSFEIEVFNVRIIIPDGATCEVDRFSRWKLRVSGWDFLARILSSSSPNEQLFSETSKLFEAALSYDKDVIDDECVRINPIYLDPQGSLLQHRVLNLLSTRSDYVSFYLGSLRILRHYHLNTEELSYIAKIVYDGLFKEFSFNHCEDRSEILVEFIHLISLCSADAINHLLPEVIKFGNSIIRDGSNLTYFYRYLSETCLKLMEIGSCPDDLRRYFIGAEFEELFSGDVILSTEQMGNVNMCLLNCLIVFEDFRFRFVDIVQVKSFIRLVFLSDSNSDSFLELLTFWLNMSGTKLGIEPVMQNELCHIASRVSTPSLLWHFVFSLAQFNSELLKVMIETNKISMKDEIDLETSRVIIKCSLHLIKSNFSAFGKLLGLIAENPDSFWKHLISALERHNFDFLGQWLELAAIVLSRDKEPSKTSELKARIHSLIEDDIFKLVQADPNLLRHFGNLLISLGDVKIIRSLLKLDVNFDIMEQFARVLTVQPNTECIRKLYGKVEGFSMNANCESQESIMTWISFATVTSDQVYDEEGQQSFIHSIFHWVTSSSNPCRFHNDLVLLMASVLRCEALSSTIIQAAKLNGLLAPIIFTALEQAPGLLASMLIDGCFACTFLEYDLLDRLRIEKHWSSILFLAGHSEEHPIISALIVNMIPFETLKIDEALQLLTIITTPLASDPTNYLQQRSTVQAFLLKILADPKVSLKHVELALPLLAILSPTQLHSLEGKLLPRLKEAKLDRCLELF